MAKLGFSQLHLVGIGVVRIKLRALEMLAQDLANAVQEHRVACVRSDVGVCVFPSKIFFVVPHCRRRFQFLATRKPYWGMYFPN